MYPEWMTFKAREKGIPVRETAQTFLQVLVLKHLKLPAARFMGGTALVLGYNNPRFSEDVDLTEVVDPLLLRPSLIKARAEMEGWFGCPVTLSPPKKGGRTWRIVISLNRAESLKLHIDSQPFRAYTSRPLVVDFSPLPPFVCEALEVDEIMAEKVIALAARRYLGGRDLFDLWFHWLRRERETPREEEILKLVKKKIRERGISFDELCRLLSFRLGGQAALNRAEEEWKRYLPPDFQKKSVAEEIVSHCRLLLQIVS